MKDLTSSSIPRSDAEYQIEIDRLLGQIEQMQHKMHDSRERVEQTRAQMRANFDAIEASLSRLAAH